MDTETDVGMDTDGDADACHMMSDELDALLQAMRDEGLPRIPLKAVLTPVNVLWNSFDLRNELAREHSAVQRRSKQPR